MISLEEIDNKSGLMLDYPDLPFVTLEPGKGRERDKPLVICFIMAESNRDPIKFTDVCFPIAADPHDQLLSRRPAQAFNSVILKIKREPLSPGDQFLKSSVSCHGPSSVQTTPEPFRPWLQSYDNLICA